MSTPQNYNLAHSENNELARVSDTVRNATQDYMNSKQLKSFLPKRLYHLLDTLHRYKPTSFTVLQQTYSAELLTDEGLILAARKLHAQTYLRYGYITEKDLKDGLIHRRSDPYQDHADYFGVIEKKSGEVVAVARQIHDNEGAMLPVFKYMKLNKSYSHLHPSQTVEISAFAKKSGVNSNALLLLFHAMLQHSKNERHRYWLIACDKTVYMRLKALFGPVIRKVGPEVFYMGSNVIPAEIDIDKAPKYLKIGYRLSLPPMRSLRRFMYSSFTEKDERVHVAAEKKLTPKALFWDAYSKAYDALLYFYPYRHLINHVSDRVVALHPAQLLDLGCGTGNLTKQLVDRLPEAKIDAVDWSPQMLRQLHKKVKSPRLGIYERDAILFLQRSRKKYDVIVMNNVIYTISDRDKLWTLLGRRLKDGGYVVIANPDTGDSRALLKDHIANGSFLTLLRPKLMRVWIYDFIISAFGATSSYDFTKLPEMKKQLTAHGFDIVGKVERCYGGHKNGIDLLFTARKAPDDL